jgi:hypothetical protein
MGASIWKNQEFMDKLKIWGYSVDEKGLIKCIRENIKVCNLTELAEKLSVSKHTLIARMRTYGIKNPNPSGGCNNPGGRYGKSGKRRDMNKGVRFKEDE